MESTSTEKLDTMEPDNRAGASGFNAKLLYLSQWTDSAVHSIFRSLGAKIHNNILWFLIVPILLGLFCASGLSQIELQLNAEQLFTPQVCCIYGHTAHIDVCMCDGPLQRYI